MRLQRIEAENVFSIGSINIDLYCRGVVLITGFSNDDNSGNGAGKSSVANHAIVWGLFGQTYDGVKGDSIINRNNLNKTSKVTIEFLGIDNNLYKIIRTRNPNSLKLYSLYNTDISHKLEKETQLMINSLLGRSFSTFIHSDLIGPGTERSFFKLSGADQISVIENLLPINELELWTVRAKENTTLVKEKIESFQLELSKTQGKLEAVKDHFQFVNNQNFLWESRLVSELNLTKSELNRLIELESKKTLKADIIKKIVGEDWSDHFDLKQAEKSDLEFNKAVLDTEIKYIDSVANAETCIACRQTIIEKTKKEASNRLDSLTIFLNLNIKKYQEVCVWLDWVRQLTSIVFSVPIIEQYKTTLYKLESSTSPYVIDSVSERIKELEASIVKIKSNIDNLNDELKWLNFWSNGFSKDIRTMMIEEICPFLESRINQYLKQLNNPQFKATVSTIKSLKSGDIREKFNLEIKSDYGANEFDLLSVGEKQIVSFAASLAVADLAVTQVHGKSNILILDEPFMGLHKNNCDNVINFLNQHDIETIFIISNEDNLKTLIPDRIHIVKSKGQSWIE